jgi:hypothetical protein
MCATGCLELLSKPCGSTCRNAIHLLIPAQLCSTQQAPDGGSSSSRGGGGKGTKGGWSEEQSSQYDDILARLWHYKPELPKHLLDHAVSVQGDTTRLQKAMWRALHGEQSPDMGVEIQHALRGAVIRSMTTEGCMGDCPAAEDCGSWPEPQHLLGGRCHV